MTGRHFPAPPMPPRLHPVANEPDEVRIPDELLEPAPGVDYRRRLTPGGRFVLDVPETPPAVWGEGSRVLWAQGEPLIVVGPTGVGKTTVGGQLVRGRVGLSATFLGFPIEPGARRVLYLAMDRPRQIARSLARQFGADDRQVLDDRLVFWPGPPPLDLGRHPGELLNMAMVAGADTVVVDSLKDATAKLSDEEMGSGLNRAMQELVAAGIEVLALHHQRKGQNGNKPKTIEDVYGSSMLTNGAGSVVLLWGSAGDPLVELHHLKQPADTIGPLKVEHHLDGTSSVYAGFDPLAFLRNRPRGATAIEAARQMVEKTDPTDTDRKRAQRLLDRLVAEGLAHKVAGQRGGAVDGTKGATSARYFAIGADL